VDADTAFYPGRTTEEIEALYLRHFRDHTHRIQPHPQAREVFSGLRASGTRIAVITNTPSPMASVILGELDLKPDALVGGTDVPRSKPAPDMVLRACELLNVDAKEAIVVGDSRYDKEAAAAAGVRFCGFGIEGDETLERLTDLLCLMGKWRTR
jgi:phosphoglycolate phosphatase/AHBA synthesis associated protein